MTHMIYSALPVVAMATPPDQNVSPWVQFLPFVLVLAIFYFVILLPMKRRQKKVQQFLEALKVGDRIVTSSGIYGTITKITDRTVKVQIADKVTIELSKAAIAGYQGQDPVVPDTHSSMNNLRWRILLIVVIVGACLWAIIPPGQKIRLGLDLKGGVHLVLRVQTDDALSLETSTAADRAREEIEKAGVTGATVKQLEPDPVPGVGHRARTRRRPSSRPPGDLATTFDIESGVGTYTFTIKPNRQVQLREDAVVQAQQTIERRVNELGVAEPVVARQGGSSGDQLMVQLPGVTRRRAGEGDHPVHGDARAEAGRAGPGGHEGSAARGHQRPGAAELGGRSRAARATAAAARRRRSTTWCTRRRS